MSLSFDVICYILDPLVIYGSRYKTASLVCKHIYNHLKSRFPDPKMEFGEPISVLYEHPLSSKLFDNLRNTKNNRKILNDITKRQYPKSLSSKTSIFKYLEKTNYLEKPQVYVGMTREEAFKFNEYDRTDELNVWLSQDITLDFVVENKHLNWDFGSIIANPYITNDNNFWQILSVVQPFIARNNCNRVREEDSCVHWPYCLFRNVNISINTVSEVIRQGYVIFYNIESHTKEIRDFFRRETVSVDHIKLFESVGCDSIIVFSPNNVPGSIWEYDVVPYEFLKAHNKLMKLPIRVDFETFSLIYQGCPEISPHVRTNYLKNIDIVSNFRPKDVISHIQKYGGWYIPMIGWYDMTLM